MIHGVQGPLTLAVGNTNVLDVGGFYDNVNGTFPTDAAITMTLYNPSGGVVTGATGLAVPYASGAGLASIYRVEVPYTVVLVAKQQYSVIFTGTKGGKVWKTKAIPCFIV